eukprot:maker-scaffold220_size252247-snap-gene-0.20 protein:Tk01514 transcript:maker-scaffold220_size252247-snap-gene-0.20-mRNA-1 annotation:"hypothetical protein BRAFLDRAFT_279482"
MSDFSSPAYANHPIQIPSEFPRILKQYTKAAIRTQPKDLLVWSVSYFRCLSNGEIPPVKERLEYPIPATDSGLTPGLLRVLNKQIGHQMVVQKPLLIAKWRGICLQSQTLEDLLQKGDLVDDNINWQQFVSLAAASIAPQDTIDSNMEIICEAMSDHPEGISSSLKMPLFLEMFKLSVEKLNVDPGSSQRGSNQGKQMDVSQADILRLGHVHIGGQVLIETVKDSHHLAHGRIRNIRPMKHRSLWIQYQVCPSKPVSPFMPGRPGGPGTPSKPGCPPSPLIPGIPGEPCKPGNPGSPGLPRGPLIPGNPGLPFIPGMPDGPNGPGGPESPFWPCSPGLPGSPGGPLLPPFPLTPGNPVIPGRPGGPDCPLRPGGPGKPASPRSPFWPGNPGIPGIPEFPFIPSRPGSPFCPGIPGIPSLPFVPGIPEFPCGPGYPRSPLTPGSPGPGVPGRPSSPGFPGKPGFPFMPGLPLIPGSPGSPLMPGLPSNPGIPGIPANPLVYQGVLVNFSLPCRPSDQVFRTQGVQVLLFLQGTHQYREDQLVLMVLGIRVVLASRPDLDFLDLLETQFLQCPL